MTGDGTYPMIQSRPINLAVADKMAAAGGNREDPPGSCGNNPHKTDSRRCR
jgi:hypothetical protein